MTSRIPGLVSVVVPIFNAERFLRETISTVFEQTYRHWELLLVNDGSEDGSAAIAHQFVDSAPDRVFFLEHPNGRNMGPCATRNLGIERSRGEFVAFLDADDIWLPEKLERQTAALRDDPSLMMVCGHTAYFNHPPDGQPERIPRIAPAGRYGPLDLLGMIEPTGPGVSPCICGYVLRYELLARIGGFDAEFEHRTFEDQAFLVKAYVHGEIMITDDCWDKYRCSVASLCGRTRSGGAEPEMLNFFLRWTERYLREQHIHNPEFYAAIHRAEWALRWPTLARIRRRFGVFANAFYAGRSNR